ncbi:MAG: hypothetical protein ABI076_01400 [Acidobacteriaceae bacterium]
MPRIVYSSLVIGIRLHGPIRAVPLLLLELPTLLEHLLGLLLEVLLDRLELPVASCLHLMELASHILGHAGIPVLVDFGGRNIF